MSEAEIFLFRTQTVVYALLFFLGFFFLFFDAQISESTAQYTSVTLSY